jgi:NAD(P) transhydrogenase subunit alpha
MKPGAVILDMAVEFGGNCELSEKGKTVVKHGVTIIGEQNLPSLVPYNASEMYSKNLLSLIEYSANDGNFIIDMEDEIFKGAVIVKDGEVVNQRTKDLLK